MSSALSPALSPDVPLVGRDVLIAGIGDAVRQAAAHGAFVHGAFVYGDTGTGKSALARHLLTSLQGEFVPFLVTPAPALGTVPYGALAPFLGEASAEDMASSLAVLRTVLTFLRTRAAGRPVLVLVDDAHLLDDDSSHLLAQLVAARTIGLVAFARPVAPVSDELVSLCRDGLLQRFDVGPLRPAEAFDLCGQVLGSTIVRGAGDRLCAEASGNPLFLKAILGEALARGSLTRPEGVWILDTDEVGLPAALVDLVRSIRLGLDELGRRAFDVVALAGMVVFADVVRLSSEAAVTVLLDQGLISTVPEHPAFVTHAYPLYGRIGRSLVPLGRSTALHRELRLAESEAELPVRAAVRDVLWSLDCGEAVPDDRLVEAAEQALTQLDPRSALRCADAVRSGPFRAIAGIHRAAALLDLGRLGESLRAAERCPDAAVTPKDVAAAGILALRQILAHGEDPLAMEEILGWWSSWTSSWSGSGHPDGPVDASVEPSVEPLPDPLPDPAAELRECEHHLVTAQALSWNLLGQYGRTVEVLERFLAAEDAGPRVVILAEALLAEALGALGRGLEGRLHSSAALAAAERHRRTVPDLHRIVLFRHVSLLVHSGDYQTAEQAIRSYEPGGDPDYAFLGGSLAVLSAALDARRGSFREALRTLRPALESLKASDQDCLLPYALGVTAWTAATLGEVALAARCSKELAAVQHRGSRQYALLGRAFDAAARALLRRDQDGSSLAELATAARGNGWASAEKDILELATALGDEQAPALLLELTRTLEGAEAEVLHAYAAAVLEHDAAALAAAGDSAELIQKNLLAVDACRRAMDLHAREGDARAQRALAAVLRRRRTRIDGGLAVEPLELDGGPLTSREQEIALLTVQGLSNREIAHTLTVSTRTVEGHLYRIYVKLGISRREELTAELGTFLRAI